jgi:hypothetical protein
MSHGMVKPAITAEVPTPQQREPVTTIFERSVEGRRAAVLPPTDVPETPLEDTTGSRAATSTSTRGRIRWAPAR